MDRLFGIIPRPAPMRETARVYDLKARLDWGEPALTIIDVRDRALFNERHVMGAISMSVTELVNRALSTLELGRDIYVYASTDEEATIAAEQLRAAGYAKVSVLRGGVAAWKAAGFPTETTGNAIAA
ncbi:rhodanese-like domain-containing protein [Oscillatoria sp. CS-180]|uniref:rhodanese-like domain-containing protein n=1 Tax=Oscillatoria sp. CS-180 TaxID=3021720 RepID=UPI002330C4D0|nr:rhodanese-like domain-containing protein [Oscillatoria sp. CS-180]MDB9529499.1 rhodanese-like domain-containing protein [Oscillatoria sp. CS-180]